MPELQRRRAAPDEDCYVEPAGKKLLEKSDALAQASAQIGQDVSQKTADELKLRLIEALRQKGHKLEPVPTALANLCLVRPVGSLHKRTAAVLQRPKGLVDRNFGEQFIIVPGPLDSSGFFTSNSTCCGPCDRPALTPFSVNASSTGISRILAMTVLVSLVPAA